MAEFPAPREGILLTHFIVSDDVERSRRFYTEVLGGETVMAGEPSFVALATGPKPDQRLPQHPRGGHPGGTRTSRMVRHRPHSGTFAGLRPR
jgi:catechol 2,3-dioxygenase-like lactoylglutathione lyase family enzyme